MSEGALSTATDSESLASLAERIAERIRIRILYGEYVAGRRILEREITEEFSVSRTPAREVLRILHMEGVLEILPSRGAQVPLYDRRLIESTIEVVEYMESAAGELACRRINNEQINHIAFLTEEMHEKLKKQDRLGYYALNKQIHEEIVKSSNNSVLITDYIKYNGRLYRTRFLPGDNDKNVLSAMKEHIKIVELLRERDGVALSALLANHLSHAWRRAGIYSIGTQHRHPGGK